MTIMSRSGAEFWWKIKPPPDVHHYYHDGHQYWGDIRPGWNVHTWTMEHKKRTDNIRYREEVKRVHSRIIPCYVWVFHNDSWIMGGWYVYIKTLKDDYALNFRTHRKELIRKIIEKYPCGLLFDQFDLWAQAFAQQFRHIGFKRKKNQGIVKAKCKIDERGYLVDIIL